MNINKDFLYFAGTFLLYYGFQLPDARKSDIADHTLLVCFLATCSITIQRQYCRQAKKLLANKTMLTMLVILIFGYRTGDGLHQVCVGRKCEVLLIICNLSPTHFYSQEQLLSKDTKSGCCMLLASIWG